MGDPGLPSLPGVVFDDCVSGAHCCIELDSLLRAMSDCREMALIPFSKARPRFVK